jgi:uncharacterized protein DUF190
VHLAGATVLRGHVGFGHSTHIHTTKILRLSQDLPVVVEIVDTQEKIDKFLPVLDNMMTSGLMTIEKVQVLNTGRKCPSKPDRTASVRNMQVKPPNIAWMSPMPRYRSACREGHSGDKAQ